MEHDFVLAELDSGTCGGCEEAEPPTHRAAATSHQLEGTAHARLAERQARLAERIESLSDLLGRGE